MELHIPCSLYPKVPEKDYVWGSEGGSGRDPSETLRNEADNPDRGQGLCGSCPYVHGCTAEAEYFRRHGISEGEKQPDDF